MKARAALWVCLVSLSSPAGAQYPSLSESEIAQVQEEVTAAIQTFYRFFNERDPKALSERLFHMPWVYLDPSGARPFSRPEETAALFEESLAQIVPRGWERSEFPSPNVCVLSLGAATVSGNFYRYRKGRERALGARRDLRSREDHGRLAGCVLVQPSTGEGDRLSGVNQRLC